MFGYGIILLQIIIIKRRQKEEKKKILYRDYYPFNMMDGCLNEKQILYGFICLVLYSDAFILI